MKLLLFVITESFKAYWLLHVPQHLTEELCIQPRQRFYLFHMILRIDSHYFRTLY